MRKYLLGAAATAALSCFAAPAMAQQCGGDQELTFNSDGTTTCGDQFNSPLMQGADTEVVLSEDLFVGHDLYTTEQITVFETDDVYEITLFFEEALEGGPSDCPKCAQETVVIYKDSGQTTRTTNLGGTVDVRILGRGATLTVSGTVTRVGPRTVTSTSVTRPIRGGGTDPVTPKNSRKK